jgi:hypothetical protein
VGLQVELLELATYNNRERFIVHLLDRALAMLQHPTPPPSNALGYALEYGHAHLVPLLEHARAREHAARMRRPGQLRGGPLSHRSRYHMTRLDYRWNATAEGWARYAAKDEQMADLLAAAAGNRRR